MIVIQTRGALISDIVIIIIIAYFTQGECLFERMSVRVSGVDVSRVLVGVVGRVGLEGKALELGFEGEDFLTERYIMVFFRFVMKTIFIGGLFTGKEVGGTEGYSETVEVVV